MELFYTSKRAEWREYLEKHFETSEEIWFVFPPDIMEAIEADETVRENYERFSEPYRRIRIAYIDAARKRPEEFQKRLNSFVGKTRAGKRITGYGGIEKYYQ